MKYIIPILLLITLTAHSQTYHGFIKYTVDGDISILVHFPADTSGGKKFGVYMAMGGNGEIGSDPNILFNVGLGRQFINMPAAMPDSIIYVMLLSASNQAVFEQPNNLLRCVSALDTHTGRADTTNFLLAGLSQGAINTIGSPAWVYPPDGTFAPFGSNLDYRFNRFHKFLEASMCGVRSGTQFGRFAGKHVLMYHGSADGTCNVNFTNQQGDSLIAHGATVNKYIIAGGSHGNDVWDSAFSPLGLDSNHNSYLLLMGKSSFVVPTVQAKVHAFFDFFYSGFDQNHPKSWFDGNIATSGSPRKWQDYYGMDTIVSPQAIRHYFTKWGRCRGWFDLTGVPNLTDTTKKFKVLNISGYSAGTAGYKMYFFNGDKILRDIPHNRWKAIARPDLYLTPFDSLVTTSSNGWVSGSMTVPDSMRYVFVIIQGSKATFDFAKFTEIKINGNYLYDTLATTVRSAMYAGSFPNQKDTLHTLKKKSGVNWFTSYGPHSRLFDGLMRSYWQTNYDDSATAQGLPTKFKFNLNLFGDLNVTMVNKIKSENKAIYFTHTGGSAYVGARALNVDTIDAEPSNPANYIRHGLYLREEAKVLGSVATGTNMFTGTVPNGQRLVTMMGTGNETDGHGADNLDMAAMMNSAYDGYESTLMASGTPIGIKNADPSMNVVMPALVELDSMELYTQYFYAKILRTDGAVPFDVIDGHKYFDITDSLGGVQRDANQKVLATSASAEQAINSHTGLVKYMDTLLRRVYNYYPTSMPFLWSETGRSQYGHAAPDAGSTGIYDQSVTPAWGIYDSTRAKAILNAREMILTLITPISQRYLYSLVNQAGTGTTQFKDRFYAMGRGGDASSSAPFEVATFFPDWYLNASIFSRLQNYTGDMTSIILDGSTTGRWQLKLWNAYNDSVCYVTWYGSRNGQSATQSISLPLFTAVEEVVPSFTSETGVSSALTPSAGVVSRTVTEVPVMYFGREATGVPPPCTTNTSPTNGSTITTQTSAFLAWSAAAGATGYKVYEFISGGSPPGTPTYITTGPSAVSTKKNPATVYKYYVVPFNGGGDATGCATSFSTYSTAAFPSVILKLNRK